MKEEILLQEKIKLLEKEVASLADTALCCQNLTREIEEIKLDLNTLKLFLLRHFPGFKEEFLELVGKAETIQGESQ